MTEPEYITATIANSDRIINAVLTDGIERKSATMIAGQLSDLATRLTKAAIEAGFAPVESTRIVGAAFAAATSLLNDGMKLHKDGEI